MQADQRLRTPVHDKIEIRIRDNGIPIDIREKIFNPKIEASCLWTI